MAEALAKKNIVVGTERRWHGWWTAGKMIATFKAPPTSELDIKRLLQLKLSLEEKLSTIKELDGEILDLVEGEAVEGEIEQAGAFKATVYAVTVSTAHLQVQQVAVQSTLEPIQSLPDCWGNF